MMDMKQGSSDSKDPNITFLDSMIKHHKDALVMTRAFLKIDPGVRLASASELARKITSAQTAEIERMQRMIDEAKSKARSDSF